jgi:hypothetical protein
MYKAKHQPSGQRIIILDERWRAQIDYLRSLDKRDALVCPGCEQPVRVRAGRVKRWHFAHKHLGNCPFERESPALLGVRAALYQWLVSQFSPEDVLIEKILDPPVTQRHIDCWVQQQDRCFAYWIFERRTPPDERRVISEGFKKIDVNVNWLFSIDLLREDEFKPRNRLHLTTTERAFIQQSELDKAWQTHIEQLGGSLHYLDADKGILTTYRNLKVIHTPQLYAGIRLRTPLGACSASTTTGEFIHPGEMEQYGKRQDEIARKKQKAQERLQKGVAFLRRASEFKPALSFQNEGRLKERPFKRVGTCKICGTVTSDWVTYFGSTKECICRKCKGR